MSTTPNLLIAFGPRGLLSIVAIFTIIGGVWHVDRMWDEKGSQAYYEERATMELVPNANEYTGLLSTGITIPEKDLNKAFPFPWIFLLGWVLFGLSYFFPVDGSLSLVVNGNVITAAVVCLILGWVASVPMGEAVRFRDGIKKTKLSLVFVASWLLLTIVTGGSEPLLFTFRYLGAVTIIASMKILWKFRKMGDTWEQEGKPNPDPVVYNLGGPLFCFGWFLFWIGMASTSDVAEGASGIPIYFTWRAFFAFSAGTGMVPVVMFVDYAHDEGAEFLGFGTDGRFFGRFLESPIPFLSAWTLFGFGSLLPLGALTDVSIRQWIILANCVLQGIGKLQSGQISNYHEIHFVICARLNKCLCLVPFIYSRRHSDSDGPLQWRFGWKDQILHSLCHSVFGFGY